MAFLSFGTGVLDQTRENLQAQRDAKTEAESLAAEQTNKEALVNLKGKWDIKSSEIAAGRVNSSNFKTFGNPEDANYLKVDIREGQAGSSLLEIANRPDIVNYYLNDERWKGAMTGVIANLGKMLATSTETDKRPGISAPIWLRKNGIRMDNPVYKLFMAFNNVDKRQHENQNPPSSENQRLKDKVSNTSMVGGQGKNTRQSNNAANNAIKNNNLKSDDTIVPFLVNKTGAKFLTSPYPLTPKDQNVMKNHIYSPDSLGI